MYIYVYVYVYMYMYICVCMCTCTANPRITRLIRSEKSSRNTKTRKVNN